LKDFNFPSKSQKLKEPSRDTREFEGKKGSFGLLEERHKKGKKY
jgi:hypothetical protein